MGLPKIEERKLTKIRRPDGFIQYIITLPKEYGEALNARGVTSLYIVFNSVLAVFPADSVTEEDLMAFLKARPELEKLLAKKP